MTVQTHHFKLCLDCVQSYLAVGVGGVPHDAKVDDTVCAFLGLRLAGMAQDIRTRGLASAKSQVSAGWGFHLDDLEVETGNWETSETSPFHLDQVGSVTAWGVWDMINWRAQVLVNDTVSLYDSSLHFRCGSCQFHSSMDLQPCCPSVWETTEGQTEGEIITPPLSLPTRDAVLLFASSVTTITHLLFSVELDNKSKTSHWTGQQPACTEEAGFVRVLKFPMRRATLFGCQLNIPAGLKGFCEVIREHSTHRSGPMCLRSRLPSCHVPHA
ncbi:hypothetical protein QBC43DRAFT_140127 [Cladorrhinum sp. PSN259]|nr:hypothetical protein QBC43DRAFT_140127 [Cladorrhinum sp. PSN259]